MEIVVCLKQVPDTESQIKISGDKKSIETGDIKWVMNPYDEYAVEEALKLKEKFKGSVTVVSAGPARVVEALRTALAMGADKAIHIEVDTVQLDSYGTAELMAAAIKEVPHDLIFTGQRAVDNDQTSTGAALAEFLGIPQLSLITKVDVADDASKVTVQRPVEGQTLVIESSLPALITAQKGLNEPRYASLPGIMKAKRKPMDKKDPGALGVTPSSKSEVVQIIPPPERAAGKIIDGETAEEKAIELVRLLHDEAKLV
ncbi:MAG: electron transfer flavoprotein subunit beta/FixA family protein [Deltaproteobacteria bacterium]|nr:electron transfer flavoprotein subunit beta/FixA family protein [Deltaproteobacteria bacterium]MBW2051517.1 electron transfer flavoprotein subunit beta/FixA family protein [Deltaproteobacteria bacterium]MBW2139742.1 electron transfer flavoprotein subunit beta/FixA family protein [Deltaproteobacteria bacterium]MBW2322506.1 electron transfer flavoprotein subunit beta/FixA family protein [Deltaproteobacteria bacterium]